MLKNKKRKTMNAKFKFLLLLLVFSQMSAQAEKYKKRIYQGYLKSQVTALNISNKFGNIEINDFGGDSVTLEAVVLVDDVPGDKARQILDHINIYIKKNGREIEARTVIADNFKTKGNFSINYKINIPQNRDLAVSNKFGNVVMNDLAGKGHFEIAYGNLTAGNLKSPVNATLWLSLSYGKGDIGSVNEMNGEIKYSKLYLGNAGNIAIESKYSGLNADRLANLHLDSKYDEIRINEITGISSVSKYTNYTFGKLFRNMIIDTEYGSLRIDEVSPDFEAIQINNSYGGIAMGLTGKSYLLDAECDYCDIKYPSGEFRGSRIKNSHVLKVKGSVGSDHSGKKVYIRSRYGGINLNK